MLILIVNDLAVNISEQCPLYSVKKCLIQAVSRPKVSYTINLVSKSVLYRLYRVQKCLANATGVLRY